MMSNHLLPGLRKRCLLQRTLELPGPLADIHGERGVIRTMETRALLHARGRVHIRIGVLSWRGPVQLLLTHARMRRVRGGIAPALRIGAVVEYLLHMGQVRLSQGVDR